jgi:hypothetical protein
MIVVLFLCSVIGVVCYEPICAIIMEM